MKQISLFFVALLGCIASFAQVNDPNAQVREAKNFHGIHISSAFNVYLDQSNQEAIAVSASDAKYRDRIKVEVRNGILYVSYDNEGKWTSGNKKLKAYISFKQIDDLKISGACDVMITGNVKADDLSIELSGASDMKGVFNANKITVDLNGASDMTISGSTKELSVEASGASDFKGFDLITETGDFKASGASDIKVTVNKELSAHATGASDISYKGEGLIRDIKTSGASSVSRKRS